MTFCEEKGIRIERHAFEADLRVIEEKTGLQVASIDLKLWAHDSDEKIIEHLCLALQKNNSQP